MRNLQNILATRKYYLLFFLSYWENTKNSQFLQLIENYPRGYTFHKNLKAKKTA